MLHDPGALFVLRREAARRRSRAEALSIDGRALDLPRIRNHIGVQFHVAGDASAEIEVRLPVVVDEDRRIDVARASRAPGGDEWLAYRVRIRANGTRRNAHADDRRTRFVVQWNV